MKIAKVLPLVAAAVFTVSAAGQASAAGIQIDADGRQAPSASTTNYGIAIDPNGRDSHSATASDSGAWPWQLRGGFAAVLHRLFGWL